MKKQFFKKNKSAGFSLIELLVTIGILVIVSSLVFFNQSQFNNNVLIENLAYEISLAIRQAQSYGLQVRETEVGGDFDSGYGVYFEDGSSEFIIFADLSSPANNIYDDGTDLKIDTLVMTNGNQIDLDGLCAGSDSSPTCGYSNLNIGFIRPNPNALIRGEGDGSDQETAQIKIISPKGSRKTIYINSVGQISVIE